MPLAGKGTTCQAFKMIRNLAASKAAVPGWGRKIQSEGWKERSSCWKCCWRGSGVAQGGMWSMEVLESHELGTPACLMVSCWNTRPLPSAVGNRSMESWDGLAWRGLSRSCSNHCHGLGHLGGWILEQLGLVERVPAHGTGMGF